MKKTSITSEMQDASSTAQPDFRGFRYESPVPGRDAVTYRFFRAL